MNPDAPDAQTRFLAGLQALFNGALADAHLPWGRFADQVVELVADVAVLRNEFLVEDVVLLLRDEFRAPAWNRDVITRQIEAIDRRMGDLFAAARMVGGGEEGPELSDRLQHAWEKPPRSLVEHEAKRRHNEETQR